MGRRVVVLLLLPGLLGAAAGPATAPAAVALLPPPCARVRLSEFLPQPLAIDWDGDGTAGPTDEWIELHNEDPTPCDVGRWTLDDYGGSTPSGSYTIPVGTVLEALGYRAFFRRDTGIQLHDAHDRIRLRNSEGRVVCDQPYDSSLPDRSWGLTADGSAWALNCVATPGGPNVRYCRCYLPLVAGGR